MSLIMKVNEEKTNTLLCLEYANTLLWHASSHPQETLFSYVDLVGWSENVNAISKDQAKKLLGKARKEPEGVDQAFRRAIAFREVLYRIFSAVSHKRSPLDADMIQLNNELRESVSNGMVIGTGARFQWNLNIEQENFDTLIMIIALSAAELLVSERCNRIGQCADERGCGWLFLDTSKNYSRRWCDINDCGNRAKQRRHYERSRRAKGQQSA